MEYAGKLKVCKLNIDENQATAPASFGIPRHPNPDDFQERQRRSHQRSAPSPSRNSPLLVDSNI